MSPASVIVPPSTLLPSEHTPGPPAQRGRLFSLIQRVLDVENALYPGSYVDIAPSFVISSVTYVDTDGRAARFFADREGIDELIADPPGGPGSPDVSFIHGDTALAVLDPRLNLFGVVRSRNGDYTVTPDSLDTYLVPKSDSPVTRELIEETGRGVVYTRTEFAYLFERIK